MKSFFIKDFIKFSYIKKELRQKFQYTQPVITYSKLTVETRVKYVQS